MAGDREIGDETRNQMMQNLFGEQSEDEEEEVSGDAAAAANYSDYQSDEVEGAEHDVEGETEGQGEVEVESEGEARDVDLEQGESDGGRVLTSPEKEVSEHQLESEGKDVESEDDYGQRVVTSRRREVIASESEGSGDNQYADHDNEDEEVNQARKDRSSEEEKDGEAVRNVFGDSDEDEGEYGAQNDEEQHLHRSPMEEDGDGYEKELRPEDMVPDEDAQYMSEDEQDERKPKEKPVGPPLELEIPLRPPPGRPDRMNMIRVSNIMGIERKDFDPKTYVEEDVFVTDDSGTKKRIRLEDNIVRYRYVKKRDGTKSVESNARFVKWSDGSMQLLIGNEVLNITVQEALHDQTHLFLRHHGKGILQSQGRLLRKMRFTPSSLTSKSHRLLTALVDSRHKKVYKVKNCITDIDPEKEKEQKEKTEGQSIKANELLHRKREKVKSKYAPTIRRERQLSPGFLEDGPEEEDDDDYYDSRRGSARRRFEEDLEEEAQAERRIINAKKANVNKNVPRKTSMSAVRPPRRPATSESDREESEYETDGEDIEGSPTYENDGLPEHEDEYQDDEDDEEAMSEEEEEEPRRKKESKGSHKRKEIESDEDSPPRKAPAHRRKAVVFDSDED